MKYSNLGVDQVDDYRCSLESRSTSTALVLEGVTVDDGWRTLNKIIGPAEGAASELNEDWTKRPLPMWVRTEVQALLPAKGTSQEPGGRPTSTEDATSLGHTAIA